MPPKPKHAKTFIIHWFRGTDLRLMDNPALQKSLHLCRSFKLQGDTCMGILPVFCFDPRIFGDRARSTLHASLKCGPRRAQFVLESIVDLRQSLEQKKSKLLVTCERPEVFLKQIMADIRRQHPGQTCQFTIVFQEEVCSEEKAVEAAIRKLSDKIVPVWGSTLYDLTDLPFQHPNTTADRPLSDMPDSFSSFRNKVEAKCTIQTPFPRPDHLPYPSKEDLPAFLQATETYLPSLVDMGYTQEQIDTISPQAQQVGPRPAMQFHGGETAALARVQDYIWDKDLLKTYFDTRNGMLGPDYSSKLAPWLAHGNISPRFVAQECKRYESLRVENKSTYWLVFEMLWRDFFQFFSLKHGKTLFFPGGTMQSEKSWKHDPTNLQKWIEGKTGYPLVDANMRELAATGFISNRGRQNVASFLALDLHHDWRYGAEYFESTLIDYDVHCNWGNWCCAAGMTGGRINRFNIVKQSKDYDQHGDYVRYWLPELKHVPTALVHEPWKMTLAQQAEYQCTLGVDYPHPMVQPFEYEEGKNGSSSNNNNHQSHDRQRQGHRGRRQQRKRQQVAANNGNGKKDNPNRGRGQRKDMKSLKQGTYVFATAQQ